MKKVRVATLTDEVINTLIADKSVEVLERAFALDNNVLITPHHVTSGHCTHCRDKQISLLNALIALAFGCTKQQHIINGATALALAQRSMHLLNDVAVAMHKGVLSENHITAATLHRLPYVSVMLYNQALLLFTDYPHLQQSLLQVMGHYAQGGVLAQERLHVLKDYMYLVHLQLAGVVKFAIRSGYYLAKHHMNEDETRILGFNLGMLMQINEDIATIQSAEALSLQQLKMNITWFLLDEGQRQEETTSRLHAMQSQNDIIAEANILADLYATQAIKLLDHWLPENYYKARILNVIKTNIHHERSCPVI